MARRASIATGRQPSRRLGPSSTFFYSTIFAVAAVADGRAKQSRRDQWDAAISSAKEGLGSTQNSVEEEAEIEGISDASWPDDTRTRYYIQRAVGMDIVNDGLFLHHDYEKYHDHGNECDKLNRHNEDLWELMAFDTQLPGAPRPKLESNTGPSLDVHNLPPQSLWSTDNSRKKYLDKATTLKKVRVTELSVAKLVHSLMWNLQLYGLSGAELEALPPLVQPIAALTESQMRSSTEHLLLCFRAARLTPVEDVEEIGMPRAVCPTYYHGTRREYYSECIAMNKALEALFRQPGSVEDLTAKVCHNLLASEVPPNVQTYNILIMGFSSLGRPVLCDRVISSSIEAKIRPNEITCAAILNHYTISDQPRHFSDYVARIRGMHHEGLMLAKPSIKITAAGRSRLVRKPGSATKIIQKAHAAPVIFRELINGVVKFAGASRAVEIYFNMKSDSWGLDTGTLRMLLEKCAKASDWVNGKMVWEDLRLLRIFNSERKWASLLAKEYGAMLRLCRSAGQLDMYREVLAEAEARGYKRCELDVYTWDETTVERSDEEFNVLGKAGRPQNTVEDGWGRFIVEEVSQFLDEIIPDGEEETVSAANELQGGYKASREEVTHFLPRF